MFSMDLAWWEFMARGAIIYLALLVMVRSSGRRTVSQLAPFDLLIIMLLSESVSNGPSGGDTSVSGGLIIAATLIALNASVGPRWPGKFPHLRPGQIPPPLSA